MIVAYFGNDEWEPFAPGLKKIDDATDIRRRILLAFEEAEVTEDPAERARLLTFAIIGGGPTGVEMAGAIAELARKALARDFRNINPGEAHVMLVQSGPRLLPVFHEKLSRVAERTLTKLGVEVRTGNRVTECDGKSICFGDQRMPVGTVIWAAGVAGSQAAKWLGGEKDRAGRVVIGPDLSFPGHPEIMVVGDTAATTDVTGQTVPGVAPAAKQAGRYAARAILARLGGKTEIAPFRYRHAGNMATVGRHGAVTELGWIKLWGRPAWFLWGAAHIWFLIGFRNRMVVLMDWMWNYLTFRRGARLITGTQY